MAEARDRACFLATVRAPPAFFAVARDPDRFVAVVRAPRVCFAEVRFPGRLFVARSDFEAERFPPLELPVRDALLACLADGDSEEPRGVDRPDLCPPDGVPFDPANRISRTSSKPAATAPSIMPAPSSCLTAMRATAMARGSPATLRLNTPPFRLWRQAPVPGNLDDAATMTVTGPTLTPLARVFIGVPFSRPVLTIGNDRTQSTRPRSRAAATHRCRPRSRAADT